jgi:two-component system, sensor histidine kinase and response regulator
MGGTTVLVVDDDEAIIEVIRAALEYEGYGVLSAVNGAALQVAHDRQPDLILLDIMMPNMDGVEVSRRLRADPATASIPIVVMSAHSRMRAIGDTMAVDDRLPKPFELGDLYATVARWTTAP